MRRILNVSSRLGVLIAVGTGICGVSAIVATAPAIKANDDEVSYSVTTITLLGMAGLFLYPFLSHFVFQGDATMAGMFLGTSIHDTSQIAGAGQMYSVQYDAPQALDVAATTKLLRNLCMGLIIPVVAIVFADNSASRLPKFVRKKRFHFLKWSQWIPGFVLGFVALVAFRTLGDMGERPFFLLEQSQWDAFLDFAGDASVLCLATAMAAVGLGTSFDRLRSLGWKSLIVGVGTALLVGIVSVASIRLLA